MTTSVGRLSRRDALKLLAGSAAARWTTLRAGQADDVDVLVVGAGIAGLYAAWLLEEQGARTLVLEASRRVGGRLLTLDRLPGAPEAGGQTLDVMYARALSACQSLGLSVYPRKPFRVAGRTISAGGKLMALQDWAASPINRTRGAERATAPDELANFYLDRDNPLRDLADWQRADFAALDARTFRAELLREGASGEALRWMEHLYDGRGLAKMSALFAYRKRLVANFGKGQFLRISGGSARLPEALARRLSREVRFGAEIVAVRNTADGVELRTADGASYRARDALISAPFSVVRDWRFDPPPWPPLAELIRTLPYNHITQVKLAFSAPFWESDGLPPAMVGDSLFEKVFATPDESGELHQLNCWIDGVGAARLDRYSESEIGERVRRAIEAARPAARGKLAVVDVTAWGRNRYARGSYHFWGPGQVTRLTGALQEPWGRVRWIGEHTARLQQGIEGAMESAEREVVALLSAPVTVRRGRAAVGDVLD
jgi:monoamine oxidase